MKLVSETEQHRKWKNSDYWKAENSLTTNLGYLPCPEEQRK